MIQRQLWCSRLTPEGLIRITSEGIAPVTQFPHHPLAPSIATATIFQHQHWLYGYLESPLADATEQFATAFLADYCVPVLSSMGPCLAHRLLDIFHDGSPSDSNAWRRPEHNVTHRIGSLARLKPDTYSRYVFYHYQRQAELPHGFNQTYIIGAHDQTIFSYQELPARIQTPPPPATLPTHHTPPDWQSVMEPHFEPWSDTTDAERLWRILPCLWSYHASERRAITME